MRTLPVLLLVAAAAATSASPAMAQTSAPRHEAPVLVFGGGELIYARPQGDFGHYVNDGWGGAGHVLLAEKTGILALRLDLGLIQYGNERQRACLSTTLGCRVVVDLNTSNNIVFAGLGPQLMLPNGPLRPYLNGSAGFSYFFTQSSVNGTDNSTAFASTTNFHDGVFSTAFGGGLYVPITVSKARFAIDLGARYHWNGETRYLRKGSIIDQPDGNPLIEPIESRTDLLTYHVGVSFGRW